ncbi:MAG: recombinase family protein, partial [Lachnospiraceae bacterium]|nr:recombinase family protein [Lachnospiraceae bacterium]
ELREETQLVADLVQQCIRENASVALDQNEYQKRYDALVARYNKANDRLEAVTAEITDKELRRATIEDCLAAMEKLPTVLETFDETAFHSLVDYITVYSNEDVRVTFKDGTEIHT